MFIIETDNKQMVAGYEKQHMIIQTTDSIEHAKKFKTVKSANTWGHKYAHAGYGLGNFVVVPVIPTEEKKVAETVTVRKNWKKKIEALTTGNNYTVYTLNDTLNNNFEGYDVFSEDLNHMVLTELNTYKHASLRYNKETGHCVLHIHSNCWYEWIQKIDW